MDIDMKKVWRINLLLNFWFLNYLFLLKTFILYLTEIFVNSLMANFIALTRMFDRCADRLLLRANRYLSYSFLILKQSFLWNEFGFFEDHSTLRANFVAQTFYDRVYFLFIRLQCLTTYRLCYSIEEFALTDLLEKFFIVVAWRGELDHYVRAKFPLQHFPLSKHAIFGSEILEIFWLIRRRR